MANHDGPEIEKNVVSLNIGAIVQTVIVAAMVSLFAWMTSRIEHLSENLTISLATQKNIIEDIKSLQDDVKTSEARIRHVEIRQARELP
jgi:uncharacterized membrane protein YhiD involved in acid resistance